MKVLLFSTTNNIKNGYGNLTHECCKLLQKMGIDFTLLLPKDEPHYSYVTYKVDYVLPKYIFDMKTKEVWNYLTFNYETDADIVHSLSEYPYALLAAKVARKNKKPLIIEAAGTYGVKPLLQWPDSYFLKRAYNQAKLIISMSQFTADKILEFSGTKTPIKLIHAGVNFSRFDVPNMNIGDIKSRYENKKIILTVGVMKPRKGHDVVLRAISLLKKRNDFHYVIVGSHGEGRDVYYQELRKIIVENGLEERVTFAGEVSDSDLIRYFHACDIYVHTPKMVNWNFEGFGIVYLEAGACKKPVIGAKSGGVADAVVDGQTGILVPENDSQATANAITKLLDDPILAKKMGDANYAYAKEHDWPKIAAQYVDVYNSLI